MFSYVPQEDRNSLFCLEDIDFDYGRNWLNYAWLVYLLFAWLFFDYMGWEVTNIGIIEIGHRVLCLESSIGALLVLLHADCIWHNWVIISYNPALLYLRFDDEAICWNNNRAIILY